MRAPCDGLIAATPVGSTAYNLSAGGPILAWDLKGFVVSMVAPHALSARAVVAAPEDVLRVANEGGEPVEVVIDGDAGRCARPGRGQGGRVPPRRGRPRPASGLDLLLPLQGEAAAPHRLNALVGCRRGRPCVESGGHAARAPRREPAADRARRAAARSRPERDHRRDRRRQDGAGPRARPAARRQAAARDPAARGERGLCRGRVRRRTPTRDATPSSPSFASVCRSTADELVLARRVTSEGRTRAYIQGRSVSAADLRAVASRLLAFYGQHEHRRLTLASAQLEILDAFCGASTSRRAPRSSGCWRTPGASSGSWSELRERVGARERDLDLLEFELGEIEEAAPERGRGGDARSRAQAARGGRDPAAGGAGRAGGARARRRGRPARGRASRCWHRRASELGALARRRCRASTRSASAAASSPTRPRRSPASCAPTRVSSRPTRPARAGRGAARAARAAEAKARGSIADVLAHAERCRAEHARLVERRARRPRGSRRSSTQRVAELEQRAAASCGPRARRPRRSSRSRCARSSRSSAMADASFEVVARRARATRLARERSTGSARGAPTRSSS